MAAADGYRHQADECRRLAETSADAGDRSAWLFLETAFMRLSDDAPKMLAAGAGAQRPPPFLVVSNKVKGRRRR